MVRRIGKMQLFQSEYLVAKSLFSNNNMPESEKPTIHLNGGYGKCGKHWQNRKFLLVFIFLSKWGKTQKENA